MLIKLPISDEEFMRAIRLVIREVFLAYMLAFVAALTVVAVLVLYATK